jgi:hypothetical protein
LNLRRSLAWIGRRSQLGRRERGGTHGN